MNEREQAQQHAARLEAIADQISGANVRRELRYAATFLRALADRPEPAQPVAHWLQIESAPRDGAKILLAKIVGHPDHKTALWWAVMGSWYAAAQRWWDGVEPCGLADPTHWLPISAHGVASPPSHPAPSEAAPERQDGRTLLAAAALVQWWARAKNPPLPNDWNAHLGRLQEDLMAAVNAQPAKGEGKP